MRKKLKIISILFLLSFYEFSHAEVTKYTMCKNKKEVRTLRIEGLMPAGSGCKTIYTKYGKDASVGEAKNYSSCVSFLENVKSNLAKADWKCKEISSSTVSPSGQ